MIDGNGNNAGYLSNSFPGQTTSPLAASEFYYVPGADPSQHGALRSPSPYAALGQPDPYLAVQGTSGNSTTLGSRSPNYVAIGSRYDSTGPSGSPPDGQGGETSVYNVDEATGVVTVTWTNPDGAQVVLHPVIVYDANFPSDRRIYLVGNIGNFTNVHAQGSTVIPVTFTLVDVAV